MNRTGYARNNAFFLWLEFTSAGEVTGSGNAFIRFHNKQIFNPDYMTARNIKVILDLRFSQRWL
jgi:hypothetical protein